MNRVEYLVQVQSMNKTVTVFFTTDCYKLKILCCSFFVWFFGYLKGVFTFSRVVVFGFTITLLERREVVALFFIFCRICPIYCYSSWYIM